LKGHTVLDEEFKRNFKRVDGTRKDSTNYELIEGFKLTTDCLDNKLDMYKLPLRRKSQEGYSVVIRLPNKAIKAFTVVLRPGCVRKSELEYPKDAFLEEINVHRPLMDFAELAVRYGLSCLFLSVVFMHGANLSSFRPWPQCAFEVCAVVCAGMVAFGALLMQTQHDREREENTRLSSEDDEDDDSESTEQFRRQGTIESLTSKMSVMQSSRLSKKVKRLRAIGWRVWRAVVELRIASEGTGSSVSECQHRREALRSRLVKLATVPLSLFYLSILGCLLYQPQMEPSPWEDVHIVWPPLFEPRAVAMHPTDKLLYATSGRQLAAQRRPGRSPPQEQEEESQEQGEVTFEPPLRLPAVAEALLGFGSHLAVVSSDGFVSEVQQDLAALQPSRSTSLPGLAGRLAGQQPLVTVTPLESVAGLRTDATESSEAMAFAGAPPAQLWGSTSASSPDDHEATAGGILAVAWRARRPAPKGSDTIVLYVMSPSDSAPHQGSVSMQPFARLRPRLPSGETISIRLMHICAMGACADDEPTLWVVTGAGALLRIGLSTSSTRQAIAPWGGAGSSDVHVIALTGNSTHLIAFAKSSGGDAPSVSTRAALYHDLVAVDAHEP